MRINSAFIGLTIIALSFLGCKQPTQNNTTIDNGEKISSEEIKKSAEDIIFPLPEPGNISQMLIKSGAIYNNEPLNPPSALEEYFTSNVKAINLGVYAADLTYALVYNQRDDIDAYTKTLKKLIDDLDIKVVYKSMANGIYSDETLTNDSLVKITTKMFTSIYEFLYTESDASLAALMVNGFYVESLYLATQIAQETINNEEIIEIIASQHKSLKQIMELNAKFENAQYLNAIQGSLEKLQTIYNSIEGSITEEQLKAIESMVGTIRTSIVA